MKASFNGLSTQPVTDDCLREGKLSVGVFSPSSISFNDNAIHRKKFHSSKPQGGVGGGGVLPYKSGGGARRTVRPGKQTTTN